MWVWSGLGFVVGSGNGMVGWVFLLFVVLGH